MNDTPLLGFSRDALYTQVESLDVAPPDGEALALLPIIRPQLRAARRLKGAARIVKDHLRMLEENEHIGMMRLRRCHETQGNRDKIGSRPIDVRANIHSGMGGIPTGQFNDLDLPLQVEGDEVARRAARFMPHKGIHLKGAWPPVMQIV
jgi:hypothetical protein